MVMLNRRISNPHLRVEFVKFLHHISPQKNVSQRHERENRLYKDAFFNNEAMKDYLMHALIVCFSDSERLDYYTKFGYRYASAYLLEYIWQDKH